MTVPSGTVTLLFTDIEGSTRLWESQPGEMREALQRHDVLVREAVESAGGYVFKTVGDAFCVAFATAASALVGAVDAQRVLAHEGWVEPVTIRVRMALHSGACTERDGDYFGPTVNRVARLEAIGHGGQVLVSGATVALLGEDRPGGVGLRDMGQHRLKDLSTPEHVFQIEIDGLPSDFPALRSLTNPELSNNLPGFASSLIGRERELEDVRGLVDGNRLVTLTGPGGAGKTRLAIQVAADLVDGSGDGVWLVELAAVTDPARVAGAVASVLGVTEAAVSMDDTLVEALSDQRLLIVLDNCEHLIGGVAKLAESLLRACPGVDLLATTREPLGVDGERVYRVPSLPTPEPDASLDDIAMADAVRLFVERARAQLATFTLDASNAAIVAGIVRRLDGVPLALELAAARIRSMTVAEIAERLDQRFRLLTTASRTAVARQQTLRATIDWSYDLLTPAERRALDRASVFVGGFDLAAAEAVLADGVVVDAVDVVDLVDRLVDKSLVQHDPTSASGSRYRVLESLRQYSAERLREQGIESVRGLARAHRDYYVAFAEGAAPYLRGPDQIAWLDRLDADHGNLRAALETSLDDPDPVPALRLAAALGDFWDRRAYYADAEALGPLLDRAPTPGSRALHARALALAATLGRRIGDYAIALRYAEAALAASRALHDHATSAAALESIAYINNSRGDLTEAIAASEEALDVAHQSGDTHLITSATNVRGMIASFVGDHVQARECYRRVGGLSRASGDLYGQANALINLAASDMEEERDPAGIRADLETVLQLFRELRAPALVAAAQYCLAFVNVDLGDARAAHHYLTEALAYARKAGDHIRFAATIFGFALCAAHLDDQYESGALLHGAADRLFESIGEMLEAIDARHRDRDFAHLRAALGDRAFEAALARGRELTRDETITLALALLPPRVG